MSPGRTARQPLPRPERWALGAPAPWLSGSLPAPGDLSTLLERVRATVDRGPDPTAPPGRPAAAVLAVIAPDRDGRPSVLITRRSRRLRSHRGELSFPGGVRDEPEGLRATALREAGEEVGLEPSEVEIVGRLHPIRTAVTDRWIVPFVGLADRRPATRIASPAEVDEILSVPTKHLLAPGVFWEERWGFGDRRWPISFFDLGPDVIWGATAAMLRELFARVAGVSVDPRQGRPDWIAEPDEPSRAAGRGPTGPPPTAA